MIFSNKTYDILKWIALVFLDLVAVLVMQIGQEWGLPYYQQISNTIHYIGLFLGGLVGVSYVQYQKQKASGSIPMPEDEEEVNNNEVGEG